MLHTLYIQVLLQFWLLEVRMALHLVHSWYDLGCLEQLVCLCNCEIADTNRPHKSLGNQLFHSLRRQQDKTRYTVIDDVLF